MADSQTSKSAEWTIGKAGDLTGRTYLVTGANAGVGFHAAAALMGRGARVILAGRNPERLRAAAEALAVWVPRAVAQVPSSAREGSEAVAQLRMLEVDTSSIASAASASERLGETRLDGLLLNAGLVRGPKERTETSEGHETLFATNVLGHFALAGTLLGRLAGPLPRIVWMGSSTALKGPFDFDDPEVVHGYSPMKAYARSKAAATMVGVEAQRRLAAADCPVASVVAHPGYAVDGRGPVVPSINEPGVARRLVDTLQAPFSQTKEQGAAGPLRALVDPEVSGGEFVGPAGYKGPVVHRPAPGYTGDLGAGKRLWRYLEQATGVAWPY